MMWAPASVYTPPSFVDDFCIKESIAGIVEIPIVFFDSVDASGFTSIFDGREQYAGNPPTIELFGILSFGYLREYTRKYLKGKYDRLSIYPERYLEDFLSANSTYVHHGHMNCTYYAYVPGKWGGRLVLHLNEGSRRFGAAYILALLNNVPLKIPCKLTVSYLDKEKTEKCLMRLKGELQKDMEGTKGLIKGAIWNLRKKILPYIKSPYKPGDDDILKVKVEKFRFLKDALRLQSYYEPIRADLLSVIMGLADEDTFIRIFKYVNEREIKETLKYFKS